MTHKVQKVTHMLITREELTMFKYFGKHVFFFISTFFGLFLKSDFLFFNLWHILFSFFYSFIILMLSCCCCSSDCHVKTIRVVKNKILYKQKKKNNKQIFDISFTRAKVIMFLFCFLVFISG